MTNVSGIPDPVTLALSRTLPWAYNDVHTALNKCANAGMDASEATDLITYCAQTGCPFDYVLTAITTYMEPIPTPEPNKYKRAALHLWCHTLRILTPSTGHTWSRWWLAPPATLHKGEVAHRMRRCWRCKSEQFDTRTP